MPERIICPAFVDAHVHLSHSSQVATAAEWGVYGLRDAGDRRERGLALRGRRVVSSGPALVPGKGYGGFLGRRVGNRKEIEEAVADLKKRGAGFIKAVGSGLVDLKRPDTVSPGGFAEEELRIIVETARGRGLPVSVHANGDRAIRAAVRAGARSVEHGFFVRSETLAMMADRGVFWVPTFGALKAAAGKDREARVRDILALHGDRLCEAVERGVPLAVGTDAGSPGVAFGASYIEEMVLWQRAGLDLAAVLDAATRGSKALAGFTDVPGTITLLRTDPAGGTPLRVLAGVHSDPPTEEEDEKSRDGK